MRPYSLQAQVLKLGLEVGVVEPEEVVVWADQVLVKYPYDDDVANLSLATNATAKEIAFLFGDICDRRDEVAAMRQVMGRMYRMLCREPERAHEVTRFLESFWVQQNYEVPEDMNFIWGIEDEFSLAEQGLYGTVEQATESLLLNLAAYQD